MEDSECPKCESANLSFVRYIYCNGTQHLRKQCNDCGKILETGYKRTTVPDFFSLPEVDQKKLQNFIRKINQLAQTKTELRRLADKRFEEEREYYRNVYLKSDVWIHKRNLIMAYYDSICQDCKGTATQIHHLTYENIFKERFEDLIPLCDTCHEKRHPEHKKQITNNESLF